MLSIFSRHRFGINLITLTVCCCLTAYLFTPSPVVADENDPDPEAHVETCNPGGWGPTTSVSFDVPQGMLDVFNTAASKIGASVDNLTVSANQKSKDCCLNNELVEDGIVDITGTISTNIRANGVGFPGLGFTINISKSLPIGTITFKVGAGAFITGTLPLTGSIGKLTDACSEDGGCVHGNIGSTGGPGASGAAFTISYGIAATACYSSWWSGEQCATVVVTANAATSIAGSVSYNETSSGPDCEKGLGGSVTIGAIVAYIQCTVGSFSFTETWTVFDGWSWDI